jgi:SAM-dependent methyltransferase
LRDAQRAATIVPIAVLGKSRCYPGKAKPVSDSSAPRASGWVKYYTATEGRPPRPTLLAALDRFAAEEICGTAADLGCGDGRDAIELLRRGWRVVAIDSEPVALERLRARPDLPAGARLDLRAEEFETAEWGPVELVNASFALPFCPPPAFAALWQKLDASIVTGGRFAGQLCGPRDSWAERGMDNRPITFHEETAARALFANYAVELFEIEETDSVTPRGEMKHWHIFHVVARKR